MTKPAGQELERQLFDAGHLIVAGIDEVGRGAWAGPVSVGVVMAQIEDLDHFPPGIKDSKALRPRARQALFEPICRAALGWGVGHASNSECDSLGMTRAQALAAHRAVEQAEMVPDAIIVDGSFEYTGLKGANGYIGADAKSVLVAAASILAKVTRDRMMVEHATVHQGYALSSNKGYPSKEHRLAVAQLGLSSIHRQSWSVAPLATTVARSTTDG